MPVAFATTHSRWLRSHDFLNQADSFYEYLLKTYVLFGDYAFLEMYEQAYDAIQVCRWVGVVGAVWQPDISF